MRQFHFFSLSIITLLIIHSCNKEEYYNAGDASLKFSSDTISFDTVFSTIGTSTKRLIAYNPYNKILKISEIRLAGADKSPFILNINGKQSGTIKDVDIYPKDSIYIFIQVYVDPTGNNQPLLINDSIIFTVGNNIQDVNLLAYGQDVHLLKTQTLKTQTWMADKPYLIYGDITVDTLETLTIEPGANIYFHKKTNLLVKGTIKADGDISTPVVFRNDRLDKGYDDIPGQWGGISLLPGSNSNRLNWVLIKNGTIGLKLGDYPNSTQVDLEISNSTIINMAYASLWAASAKIKAVNCVIADAAGYACCFTGGEYEFFHCTVANYFGRNIYVGREFSTATLYLSNYYLNATYKIPLALTKANFYNSIIYGNYNNEIQTESVAQAAFNYKFDHCLLKTTSAINSGGNIRNEDPKFKFKPNVDFELDTLSPAKDAGDILIGNLYPLDIKKTSRAGSPDMGAYERVEK